MHALGALGPLDLFPLPIIQPHNHLCRSPHDSSSYFIQVYAKISPQRRLSLTILLKMISFFLSTSIPYISFLITYHSLRYFIRICLFIPPTPPSIWNLCFLGVMTLSVLSPVCNTENNSWHKVGLKTSIRILAQGRALF